MPIIFTRRWQLRPGKREKCIGELLLRFTCNERGNGPDTRNESIRFLRPNRTDGSDRRAFIRQLFLSLKSKEDLLASWTRATRGEEVLPARNQMWGHAVRRYPCRTFYLSLLLCTSSLSTYLHYHHAFLVTRQNSSSYSVHMFSFITQCRDTVANLPLRKTFQHHV